MQSISHKDRRPTMIYWTSLNGTICSAEARNADRIEGSDGVFAEPFASNSIVGRNLFQFISGQEVSHLYQKLASRVATTGATISFDYRCDGPHVRRYMHMQLSLDDELIRYESTTVGEIVREKDIPSETPGAKVLVAICSFCNKYRFPVSSRAWKQLEALLLESDLPTEFQFTHSICEDCYFKALEL